MTPPSVGTQEVWVSNLGTNIKHSTGHLSEPQNMHDEDCGSGKGTVVEEDSSGPQICARVLGHLPALECLESLGGEWCGPGDRVWRSLEGLPATALGAL